MSRRYALLATLLTLALLPFAAPAEAVATFKAPQRATPNGCFNSITEVSGRGVRHGFVECTGDRTGLYYVSAARGTTRWSLSRVSTSVVALLAADDDGDASYAVYVATDGNGESTYLVERTHGGAVTKRVLSADHAAGSAAVLARNGGWWAVWARRTQQTGGSLCEYLFQSKTIGAAASDQSIGRCGQEPSLAIGQGGVPTLVYREQAFDYGGDIDVARWVNGAWSGPTRLNGADAGRQPFIQRSGHSTRVAWFRNTGSGTFDVVLATKHDGGGWRRKHFSRLTAWDNAVAHRPPTISVSGGTVFLAWNAVKRNNLEVARVVALRNGSWSGRDVGDGTSGDAVFAGLDSVDGRAYLVLDHSLNADSHTVTRHQ
jgi:hypothetical protein